MAKVKEKGVDEKFCSDCGSIIKLKAEICPKCGIRQHVPGDNNSVSKIVIPKSKTAAIFLSILFNYVTWLYTYRNRESKYKFWISVLFIVIGGLFLSVFLDDSRVFVTTGDLIIRFMFLCFLLSIPIWFWSLIDRILKPEEFFIYYPSDTMTGNNNSVPQMVKPKSKNDAIILSIFFNYSFYIF